MPATMTTMPPTTGVRRAVPGEIRAARSNPQSARVANTPNRPQGDEISRREQHRRDKGLPAAALVSVDRREGEDHRRGAGRHHARHHRPPDYEVEDEVGGRP